MNETGNETAAPRSARPLKPKDAATLIVIDRSAGALKILLGKRSSSHVFMPDTYVFPGGRRDRGDHALPFATDLHPAVMDELTTERKSMTIRGARALALAAVRELKEETGLIMSASAPAMEDRPQAAGRAGASAAVPLHCLRYIARAITPPGNVRRFDTRFFCTFADEAGINPVLIRDTEELQDLRWVDINAVDGLHMPRITRIIFDDMKKLIDNDPTLPFGRTVPFYYGRQAHSVRSSI